jgi:protein TonB
LAEKSGKRVVAAAKTGTGKSAAEKSGKNHGKAQTSGESAPVTVAPEVSVSDQPILPAKLLKAVPPVYPPDAMRSYITGDVRIEAEVDRQGHVGAMKVLLGPQQFRQAAMDALKQYEYEPATQGGKPVASKVTATIKFWFDP